MSEEVRFSPTKPAILDLAGQWRPAMALVGMSARRSLFHKRNIFLGAIALLPVAVATLWRIVMLRIDVNPDHHAAQGTIVFGLLMGIFQVWICWPLVTLWTGTASIRDEVEDQTITYLLLRPLSRVTLVFAKAVAGTFTAWTVVATSIVLSFGVLATYPPSGLFPSELPLLARDLGVALLACWAYVGVFGLLGAVYKRPYLIGVAFILIWEGVIPFVPGTIHYFTVKYYIRCVYSHPVELSEVQWLLQPLDPVSVPVAVLTLLFIGALSAGLTVWTAYRREYILEQASG